MNNKKTLILFDFDGTLITKDSFSLFIWKYFPLLDIFITLINSFIEIIKSKTKVSFKSNLKKMFFNELFKDVNINELEIKSSEFSKNDLPKLFNVKILEKLIVYKSFGHRVIIVSGSFEFYLRYLAEELGVELIATKVEIKNNRITGKFLTENCVGIQKVNRIKECLNPSDYYIIAYGNSTGDYYMLELADKSFLVKGKKIIEYVQKNNGI